MSPTTYLTLGLNLIAAVAVAAPASPAAPAAGALESSVISHPTAAQTDGVLKLAMASEIDPWICVVVSPLSDPPGCDDKGNFDGWGEG
jgi:hypothetical protein